MSDKSDVFLNSMAPGLNALIIPTVVTALLGVLMTRRAFRIDVTESVNIHASAEQIWEFASDFERNWEDSNPEHDGTRVLSDPKYPLRDGLRFWQRERVGGIVGELNAELYDVEPNRKFRWYPDVVYKLWGLKLRFPEGGTFRIEPTSEPDVVRVSHHVWGDLPDSILIRVLGWLLINLFDIDRAAAQHTRMELEYFKSQIER